jgi:hypothetical protein
LFNKFYEPLILPIKSAIGKNTAAAINQIIPATKAIKNGSINFIKPSILELNSSL